MQSGASHHSLERCEETRNVDALFTRYSLERGEVVKLLRENPQFLTSVLWTLEGPLGYDPRCLRRMGTRDPKGQWAPNPLSCSSCTSLERLIDYRLGLVERPFSLEYGREVGTSLIVRRTPSVRCSLSLELDEELEEESRIVHRKYLPYLPDLGGLQCSTHLKVDEYTSGILASWLLEEQMGKEGALHVQRLYTSFICGDDGYQVLEHLKDLEGEGKSLIQTEEHVWSLIVQLVRILLVCQKLHLTHSSLSLRHLLIRETPVSYKEGDYHVRGPWTLVLGSLDGASLQSGDVRIHALDSRNTRPSEVQVFHEGTGRVLYTTSASFWSPVPLISGSREFYSLVLQLMTIETIRRFLRESPRLQKLWSHLWKSRDLEMLNERYESGSPRTSLSGLHLKRGILEEIWDLIREM